MELKSLLKRKKEVKKAQKLIKDQFDFVFNELEGIVRSENEESDLEKGLIDESEITLPDDDEDKEDEEELGNNGEPLPKTEGVEPDELSPKDREELEASGITN